MAGQGVVGSQVRPRHEGRADGVEGICEAETLRTYLRPAVRLKVPFRIHVPVQDVCDFRHVRLHAEMDRVRADDSFPISRADIVSSMPGGHRGGGRGTARQPAVAQRIPRPLNAAVQDSTRASRERPDGSVRDAFQVTLGRRHSKW